MLLLAFGPTLRDIPEVSYRRITDHHNAYPMKREELRTLLRRHRRGSLSAADLEAHLRPYLAESIAYATVDHGRESRQGFPEVIFCEGKTPQQVAGIAR